MPVMWTILQVVICVIFLLVAAFSVGKRLGQRRYNKMHQEMKDLELYFKNLMDDMEMVSNHNMKVLETSSAEIKELLAIADKKCLYANDLLKEIDEGVDALRKRNLGVTSIDSAAEKKFRKEIHDALAELLKKVVTLNERVRELESSERSYDNAEIAQLVSAEIARQLNLGLMDEAVPVKAEVKMVACAGAGANATVNSERSSERIIPLKQPPREVFSTGTAAGERLPVRPRPSVSVEQKAVAISAASVCQPVVKKTDLEKMPREAPSSFPVRQVLDLFNEGVTLPQIARTLNMGKGEIELILKIYGESEDMRKIM